MSMSNNIADVIRLDIDIISARNGDVQTSYQTLNKINYWKQEIYRAFDGKTVGKTVYLAVVEFMDVVPMLVATWQLGASVFSQEYIKNADKIPGFEQFYNFIDLKIERYYSEPTTLHKTMCNLDYDPNVIYPTHHYILDQDITLDTIAIRTHTSGTTGMPKLIEYSHDDCFNKVKEHTRILGYTADDVPVHFHTFHHSSLFLNFALPLLTVCKVHHCAEGAAKIQEQTQRNDKAFFDVLLPYCNANNITQMIFPHEWINCLPECTAIDLSNLTAFATPGPRSKEIMQESFAKFNFKQINVAFGASEVGLMLVNKVTKDNIDDFEVGKFTQKSNMVEIDMHPEYTQVIMAGSSEWRILTDTFVVEDGAWHFTGRNETITINDVKVDARKLRTVINKYLNADFSLVPDYEQKCFYLAVYDKLIDVNLDAINTLLANDALPKEYRISKYSYLDISKIRIGAKPSSPLLLYYFRNN